MTLFIICLLLIKARQELDDLKADLFRRVRFHVMTAAEASTAFYRKVREIIAQGAMVETRPDAPVLVACSFCYRKHVIARDIKVFKCSCSPVEQFAQLQQVSLP